MLPPGQSLHPTGGPRLKPSQAGSSEAPSTVTRRGSGEVGNGLGERCGRLHAALSHFVQEAWHCLATVNADQSPLLLPAEPAGSHVLVLGTCQHFNKTYPQAQTLHPHAWDSHKETLKGRAEGPGSNTRSGGGFLLQDLEGTVLPHALPAAKTCAPH